VSPTPAGVFRAFTASSEWNKPLGAAPLDPNSSQIIAEMKSWGTGTYPVLTSPQWEVPIYWADASDPTYTIVPTSNGPTLNNVHIPDGAVQASNTDGIVKFFDLAKGVSFELWRASFDGTKWSAAGTAEYDMSSNGLDCRFTESDRACPMNSGHRGIPPAIHVIRYDEVKAGAIDHVLKLNLDKTAECGVYPAKGYESGRGGVLTCEGLVLRIKPGINLAARNLSSGCLVIAKALQTYGGVIGDTGGNAMGIAIERDQSWSNFGVAPNCFQGHISLDDFVVVKAGYHR